MRKVIEILFGLTVMSIHRFWNHEPQHPQNANTNEIAPTAIAKESALRSAYSGKSDVYPSYAIRNQIPTPSIPHPVICNNLIR